MSKLLNYDLDTRLHRTMVIARHRIKSKYSPSVVEFIVSVEKAWERFAYSRDYNELYKLIGSTIRTKARIYGQRWRNSRLSANDFESLFGEVAKNVIDKYSWANEYYLAETLYIAFDHSATDLVRKATRTEKHKINYTAMPLADEFEELYSDRGVNVEEQVTNKILIEEICGVLSEKEKKVLLTLYRNPDASLRELAELCGLNHVETVRRQIKKIQQKAVNFR